MIQNFRGGRDLGQGGGGSTPYQHPVAMYEYINNLLFPIKKTKHLIHLRSITCSILTSSDTAIILKSQKVVHNEGVERCQCSAQTW
jgi:hypothetical protein